MNEPVELPVEPHERKLEGIELLTEAPPALVRELEEKCRWIKRPTNEVIVDRDDESTEVFFIVKGQVKVMDFLANDQEILLAELGEGSSFGEMSAIDASRRSARVSTLEESVLAALTSQDFKRLLMDCPGISIMLLKRFIAFSARAAL